MADSGGPIIIDGGGSVTIKFTYNDFTSQIVGDKIVFTQINPNKQIATIDLTGHENETHQIKGAKQKIEITLQ